jgi:hypothetical protein
MTEHAGGLGDAPIDPRFHRKMNGLARALDAWFNGSLRGKEAEAKLAERGLLCPSIAGPTISLLSNMR